ncbi:MAG: FAD binding domain-containing protein [Streptosporangiales bacterium]|nr:FAD binding domain-containing protein [Streptosporangiales bacterium]
MVTFVRCATAADAVAAVRDGDGTAKFVGGGTALVLLLQMRLVQVDTLVGVRTIGDVPGWSGIEQRGNVLWIGGGVTLAEVAGSALVRGYAPSLARAASVVGNVRVRNAATLAGNIAEADYASDPPAVLVSLDASVVVHDGARQRAVLARDVFTDFYTTSLDESDLVIGVAVPLVDGSVSAYRKFASRSMEDRPCVGVAVSARFEDGAVGALEVVIGAVSGTPQRWPEITERAWGRRLAAPLMATIADRYADAVDPIADIRGSAWYRREMVRVNVRRALEEVAASADD